MKYCLTIPALLLASALCGCTTFFGAAHFSSPALELQTALQRHSNSTFDTLSVTESNGILRVHGFVDNFKQINAVEEFVNNYAVNADLGLGGRIESNVVLYADYDCHASDECFTNHDCLGDTWCNIEKDCYFRTECW